jgi:hypothetical protein
MRGARVVGTLLGLAALAGCRSAAMGSITVARAPRLARWVAVDPAQRPIDVAVGRSDGVPVVTANGRLFLLRASGRLARFAPAYRVATDEAYIALPAPGHRGCSFGTDNVYALRLHNGSGVTRITAGGGVRRFATINAPGLLDGIAFDETGRFGYRLLVTIANGSTTTIDEIDCHGAVRTVTSSAPRVEGGIAVAPLSFGRFAGELITPDENSGLIYAISSRGKSQLVANSRLPHGGDIGVESETFVPAGAREELLVADRLTPGNPHPGDDVLLGLVASTLRAAGVREGDLVVTSEGGALTDAVRCGPVRCSVRYVADGPPKAHIEGHIGFIVG